MDLMIFLIPYNNKFKKRYIPTHTGQFSIQNSEKK